MVGGLNAFGDSRAELPELCLQAGHAEAAERTHFEHISNTFQEAVEWQERRAPAADVAARPRATRRGRLRSSDALLPTSHTTPRLHSCLPVQNLSCPKPAMWE